MATYDHIGVSLQDPYEILLYGILLLEQRELRQLGTGQAMHDSPKVVEKVRQILPLIGIPEKDVAQVQTASDYPGISMKLRNRGKMDITFRKRGKGIQ